MGCQDGGGALGRAISPEEGGVERGQHSGCRVGRRGSGSTWVIELLSCLSPPPLPERNLPKPLIKSILEVIKVSPKICSFSKLSFKQNL